MRWFQQLRAFLLTLALCSGGAWAQAPAAADATPSVATLSSQLKAIPTTVESSADVRGMVEQLNAIRAATDKFIAARTGNLNDLNARLDEIGEAPAANASENLDITRRRDALIKERNTLDADIRLARLVSADAQQRATDLLTHRRAMFTAHLTERTPSPLGSEFWQDLSSAWSGDLDRIDALTGEIESGFETASTPAHAAAVLGSLALAMLLVLLGNWLAESALARLAAHFLPPGRLRRSLLVIVIVIVNVLLVGLAAQEVFWVLEHQGVWGPQTRKLGQGMVQSSIFIAFVVGLGRALLSNRRPSWRLPPITDAMAMRLAPFPWIIAFVAAIVWAPIQINAVLEASFAVVVATHVVTALVLSSMIGALLLRLRPSRTPAPAATTTTTTDPVASDPLENPIWVSVLQAGVGVVLIAIWVLVAIGYVALASFLATQLTWAGIVIAAFYVIFKFTDDLFMTLLSTHSSFGQRLQLSFDLQPRTLSQAAVVLSGLTRLCLFFYMVLALTTPLGTSPGEIYQRSGQFGGGIKIGEIHLAPGAIISGVTVLVLGFIALRILKRWLTLRYLPHTGFEPGMQSSITTLLGYVGGVLVVAFGLSALGIGIERIAWVASALSVGIGFGLQAIVQNFISGLILLAERPVNVGDWVVLGSAEGDVRRINVRATEIQLSDRSTMIVPNSEFITKIVRNMTLSNAEGRVLIRLPLPLTTHATKAREVMLAAFANHPSVLATPAPTVTLEGIEVGFLIFQAIGYVPSPRLASAVRSDVLFAILDGLRAANLPMAAYPEAAAYPGAATSAVTPGATATIVAAPPPVLPGLAP